MSTLGWVFTCLTMVNLAVLACFAFIKGISNKTRLMAAWICLSIIAILNILTYVFVSQFLVNLIIGLLLFVEIVVQACMILNEFFDR